MTIDQKNAKVLTPFPAIEFYAGLKHSRIIFFTLYSFTALYPMRSSQTVSKYLEAVNFSAQLTDTVNMLQSYLLRTLQPFTSTDDIFAREVDILFSRAFRLNKLEEQILENLSAAPEKTLKSFQRSLLYLNSPTGKEMTRLETLAGSPDELEKFPEFLASLKESPPSFYRRRLIQRLDNTLQLSYTSTKLSMNFLKEILIAVNNALPEAERSDEKSIEDLIQEQFNKNLPEFKTATENLYLFAYRNASDENLKQHVEHYESEHGNQAWKALMQSTISVLQKARQELFLKLTEALQDHSERISQSP